MDDIKMEVEEQDYNGRVGSTPASNSGDPGIESDPDMGYPE
jgi:hypothetical protein